MGKSQRRWDESHESCWAARCFHRLRISSSPVNQSWQKKEQTSCGEMCSCDKEKRVETESANGDSHSCYEGVLVMIMMIVE